MEKVLCVVMRPRLRIPREERDFSFLQIIVTESWAHHFRIQGVTVSFFEHSSTSSAKVLCYKSEGCWFDPSGYHWNFSLT